MSLAALVLTFILASQATTAQVRDRSESATPASETAKVLARGWSALANGHAQIAVRAADELLKRRPWDHSATALRVEALSAIDPITGLDAYEKWLGDRTTEDVGLLEPVASATTLAIARQADPDLRREAIRLLRGARLPVPASAADNTPAGQLNADAALAAAGDAAALQRLNAAASATMPRDKTAVVTALESAGPAGVPALIGILDSSSVGPDRGEAAAALGRLRAGQARETLLRTLQDQDPYVRFSSAVALARLGDAQGRAAVEQMLATDVPDLRLMAAEAWEGRPGPWVEAVRPLLENRDGLVRLRAAKLIAPVDPAAAQEVLAEAATDPNPAVRQTAASVAASIAERVQASLDLAALRRLLRDPDGMVRLRAAGALLAAARATR